MTTLLYLTPLLRTQQGLNLGVRSGMQKEDLCMCLACGLGQGLGACFTKPGTGSQILQLILSLAGFFHCHTQGWRLVMEDLEELVLLRFAKRYVIELRRHGPSQGRPTARKMR